MVPFLHYLTFLRFAGAVQMGLRARGKGVEVINVVFSNPKVVEHDIVALAE